MDLSTILLGVVFILLALLFRHLTRYSRSLENQGIPVDRSASLFRQNINFIEYDQKCLRKYGQVWGVYKGIRPEITIANPELVKEIMIKKFDKFPNHTNFELEDKHLELLDARDEKWRAIRKALSPTFTSGKLKGMFDHMGKVADSMIECFNEKAKQNKGIVDVKEVYQSLSLDTIANCAFGIETNSFKNPENDLYRRCMLAFSDFRIKSHLENFVMHFSDWFPQILPFIDVYGKENYTHLWTTTKNIADSRQVPRGGDFIDRLKELIEEQKKSGGDKMLNEDIVYAQGIIFFIAGFETSSNCLSTLSYNLAKNPEVQSKIADEVDRVLAENDGRIDFETINQMTYLDAAVQENLRIHPPVARLDRECSEDCVVGPYQIKEGSRVLFPIFAMHNNPEYFPEPEKFKPERFLKGDGGSENSIVPFSYIPFGGGPRQCIGMRFAMAEIKIAIAKVIKNFQIVDTPDTTIELNLGDIFMMSYDKINVRLVKRSA